MPGCIVIKHMVVGNCCLSARLSVFERSFCGSSSPLVSVLPSYPESPIAVPPEREREREGERERIRVISLRRRLSHSTGRKPFVLLSSPQAAFEGQGSGHGFMRHVSASRRGEG